MPQIDKVVAAYIKLRDDKKAIQAKHKDELAGINGKMQTMEGWLMRELNNLGVESAKTEEGTAYKSKRTSVKVQDFGAFIEFVKDNDLWHMLDKRASKAAVEEFLEAQGELPPGLSITVDQNVLIRR